MGGGDPREQLLELRHGVERWRSDCGCRFRGDWRQAWREPLRRALDGLKTQLDHLFGTRGRECFPNPWVVRNAYIQVILDFDRDRDATISAFLSEHGHPDLDAVQVTDALRLLEMQQDAMLMFTSCGWFHDELSGIETVQCLQYAARAIHLAKRFHRDFEPEFVAALQEAPSNVAKYRDGRGVWEQLVRPSVVDLDRVLAHHAISLVYGLHGEERRQRVYSFDLETIEHEVRRRGPGHLAIGRLRVRSRRTWNQAEARFVVLHFGGLDFHALLSQGTEADASDAFEAFQVELLETYRSGSMADVTTLVSRQFPGRAHRLDDLFRDEQRRIIGIILEDRFADYQRSFERLANQDEEMLNRLGQLSYPFPKPLHATASAHLDACLHEEIARLVRGEVVSLDAIERLCERGRAWGYQPERELLEKTLSESLLRTLEELHPSADLAGITSRAEQLLGAAGLLGLEPDFWQIQNRLLNAFARLTESRVMDAPLQAAFSKLADGLKVNQDLLGWRP